MRHPRHAASSLHRAQAQLNNHPDVKAVATNAVTGSMVVHYDPAQRSTGDILALLRDIGVIVADVAHAGDESVVDIAGELSGEEAEPVGHSRTALTMVDAVDDLNARLHRFTGGLVDLKLLFPLSMGAIGVAKVLRDGWQWGEIPAYVLLWYAFDAFYKLHRQPPDQLATTAQVNATAESGSPDAPRHGVEPGAKESTATGGATAGG
jgi:hypothetical protein